MKYAILGDVHSNLEALQAVVHHARLEGVDVFTCVGDVVGYGPEPAACIQLLKDLDARVVSGNHDWAVVGRLDTSTFNPLARASAIWTRNQLSSGELAWLESLPLTLSFPSFVVTHGTLHSPEAFYYMQSFYDAARSFEILTLPLCVCGHSHVPINFYWEQEQIKFDRESLVSIDPIGKTIVNVGSVGQPRDGNPLTGYGLYDEAEQTLALHRIKYDVDGVMNKILASDLPEYNAERLRLGT